MVDREQFETTATAARRLGCSEAWVRQLFDRGKLHGVKDASGRRLIPRSEVDRRTRELATAESIAERAKRQAPAPK